MPKEVKVKYACAKCQRFFHIKRNGVLMEEGRPISNVKELAIPKNASFATLLDIARTEDKPMRHKHWGPYKLFLADLYECDRCGTQLLVPNNVPIAEHWQQPSYEELKKLYEERGLLNPMIEDC